MSICSPSIQIAEIDQLPHICKLLQDAYQVNRTPAQLVDYFDDKYTVLTVQFSTEIVGVAIILWLSDEAELLDLAIHPTYQGQNLGVKLLMAVIAQMSARDVKTLFLEVRASNARAISLYKKIGFQHLNIRRNYYPPSKYQDYEDAIVMSLRV